MTSTNSELWEKYQLQKQNEGCTKQRLKKLKLMFDTIARGLNKPLDQVTRGDVEKLISRLIKDEFKGITGKTFSGSTKSDIKKFLKQYYKWLFGKDEFYPEQVAWLKTKISKDELPKKKQIILKKELDELMGHTDNIEHKTITLILFDSGFRISELFSCKKKNLTWESFQKNQKCFWIECNESKTFPRKVPIPLFTRQINRFYNSTSFKGLKPEDPLFSVKKNNYARFLKQISTKHYRAPLSPHCLRHSSATFYAKEFDGNAMLIAQRYGWSFNSKELQTYIRLSGAYQKQGAVKVFNNELLKVKEDVISIQIQNKELVNEVKELKEKMRLYEKVLEASNINDKKKQHKLRKGVIR